MSKPALVQVFLGAAFLLLLSGCQGIGQEAADHFDSATLTQTASLSSAPRGTLLSSDTTLALDQSTEIPLPMMIATTTVTISEIFISTIDESLTSAASLAPLKPDFNTRTPTLDRNASKTPIITPEPIEMPALTVILTPAPPEAQLYVSRPGLLSKVLSPLRVEAWVTPGDDGMVNLTLIGEEGNRLFDQVLNYPQYRNQSFSIMKLVDFTISGVAEIARLEMSTHDLVGRKIALYSVDLVLISLGHDDLNPPLSTLDPYLMHNPEINQIIKGGSLHVTGLARPVNDTPVIIELIDETGRTVASKQVIILRPGGDVSHTPFAVNIAYAVSGSTPVRLTLRQESSGRIPGTVSLSSMKIVLEP